MVLRETGGIGLQKIQSFKPKKKNYPYFLGGSIVELKEIWII